MTAQPTYTVLSGGVGGAKLVLGLSRILDPASLQVIANTGDDFEHLGLPVSPDLDTLMYTLADRVNPATGWGLADETWEFMDAVAAAGGPDWFRIGDRDLGTHISRRDHLQRGATLSEATRALLDAAGVPTNIWPMSDQPVRTWIKNDGQDIDFQNYFVRLKAEPVLRGCEYRAAGSAQASPGALAALRDENLAAIIITPSNPWLSIDPILSLGDIKSCIRAADVPVIAISPIVGGRAIKGPTAKLMEEQGLSVSACAVAEHYRELLDGFIIDVQDETQRSEIESLGLKVGISNTIMNTLQDKTALAGFTLDFARELAEEDRGTNA